MSNDRNGKPEFAPLRDIIKTYPIVVDIYDDKDKVVRTERMDYGNKDDRIWLGKLSYWAWSNSYVVETRKAE